MRLRFLHAGLLAAIHLVMATYYTYGVGLDFVSPGRTLGSFYHTLPEAALAWHALPEGLWYLHAQPPLFNVYAAFFYNLFPENHFAAMHAANITQGALIVAMLYGVAVITTGRAWLAFAVGLLLALDVSLVLYEAFPLYTIQTTFLLVLCTFLLALFDNTQQHRFLLGFVLALNLLVLTRSLYHLLFLLICIPLVGLLAGERWRRIVLYASLISLLSVGWYAKNAAVFGFFGASSWTGQSLWRVIARTEDPATLQALHESGVIAAMPAQVIPFSRPDAYVPYGYTQTTDVFVLAQNDYNNLNIIAISDAYLQSSLSWIRAEPARYVLNIARAYHNYALPTSTFYIEEFERNAEKLAFHQRPQAAIFEGQAVFTWLGERSGLSGAIGREVSGTWATLLIPLALAGYGLHLLIENRLSPGRWTAYIRENPVLLFIAYVVAYTTIVSVLFEIGENMRFRFPVQGLFLIFIVALAARGLANTTPQDL